MFLLYRVSKMRKQLNKIKCPLCTGIDVRELEEGTLCREHSIDMLRTIMGSFK